MSDACCEWLSDGTGGYVYEFKLCNICVKTQWLR